jgi:pSer/pThr/pTyr-binding forkhead associated (FHA) protein
MKQTNAGASSNAPGKLIVIDGPDRGKTFELDAGRQYLAGRSEECDIRIDASDKTVSRKHALLSLADGTLKIENLSQANPVQIKGRPVKNAALKHKGQFQIGAGLFTFEASGSPDTGGGRAASAVNLKIAIPAAAALLAGLLFIFIAVSGENDAPVAEGTDITRPATLSATGVKTGPGPQAHTPPSITGLSVSDTDREKAEAHFRQGMFFYDTGNLSRAVEEWSRVIAIWPDHREAQTWYLRAEKELDDKVREHYQNAMMHYKYMRYRDAVHEFNIVVELSRNKSSDHYINALRYLNELQGK